MWRRGPNACLLHLSLTWVPAHRPGAETLGERGFTATPALFGRGDPKSPSSWSRGLEQCLLWSTCLTLPFSFSHKTSKRSSFQQLLTHSLLGRKGTSGRFLYQVSGPEIRTEHPQCGPTSVLRAAAGDGSRDIGLVSPLLSSVGLWCRWRRRNGPLGTM